MEIQRFTRHFEPDRGWMNDPNGLCWFRGKVHAFYQHNPYAAHWGPMHWGHAVTEDLLHWEHLPIALAPDQPYEDFGGCFSGSALEKDGRLYLMYTSVSKAHGQTQSMAVSEDGVHFEKLPGNPVIPHSPLDPANRDFRDPKLFAWGDSYRMVCGAGVDGLASVLLFASDDLLHWEPLGPLFQSRDYGPVLECPDLFPLGDRWVLLFSRMDETRSAQFVLGDFDGERFTPGSFQQPEHGPDFYAPQTFADPAGRRLLLGWFYNWNRTVPEGAVRAGALTVPREVTLENGVLRTFPAREVRSLLTEDNPCLVRRDGRLTVTNGQRDLFSLPASQVHSTAVLADGAGREVFLNGGEHSLSFYLEK